MSPLEFGGEMIDFVYEQSASWKELPWKFEAGTPNMAGAIGLAAAVDYLEKIGMDSIEAHEQELIAYVFPKLQAIEGLTIYGSQDLAQRSGVIAFNLGDLHPHDLATAWIMKEWLFVQVTTVRNPCFSIWMSQQQLAQVFISTIPRQIVTS